MRVISMLLVWVSVAWAETPAVVPSVLHRAIGWAPAGRALSIDAKVHGDWRLDSLRVWVRPAGTEKFEALELARVDVDAFSARVPAKWVRGPRLAYAIESVDKAGQKTAHFASRAAPHEVVVEGLTRDEKAARSLARFDGQRSVFSAKSLFTAYGSSPVSLNGSSARSERFSDQVLEIEAEYLYRTLGLLHDFRFAAGALRAQWPQADGQSLFPTDDPGLTYGAGSITLEPHRWFSATLRLLLGVSAEGFVAGGGAVARIGDISATHLAVGIDALQDAGLRTDIRFHWTTIARFPMALGMEVTEWPAAADSGDAANLSYDVGWEATEAFTLVARLGVANRSGSFQGGYTGGLTARYGF